MPFFSIIVPTFNAAGVVRDALLSVESQTFGDFEILVQDGGSSDETLAVAHSLGDPRVLVESVPDQGVYDAMNRAVARASGEWIYFLGADDRLYDNSVLADIHGLVCSRPELKAVYGDVVSPRWPDRYRGEVIGNELAEGNICHQAIFHHRSLFSQFGPYDLQYPVMADWDFNMRWFFSDVPRTWVDRVIAHYADDGVSSQSGGDNFLEKRDGVMYRLSGLRPVTARWRHLLRESARDNLRSGKVFAGLRDMAEFYWLRFKQ